MESTSLSKLQTQLRELFRAADKDLNYGIYRIMHQKNKEIDGFIDKDLPKIIKENIQVLSKTASEDIDTELEDIEKKSKSLGVDPKTIARYNELLKEKKEKVSIKDLEDQIYNHLVRFFERYYQEGDFISRFYFKDGTYLIPYDGSEVDLHWVTKDMYYIKSTDQYTKFSFNINGHNVVFKVSMLEEEKGNQKGKASFFELDKIEKEHKEIIVSFKKMFENDDLRELGKSKIEIQQKLNEKIADAIKKEAGNGEIIKNIEKFQKKYTEDFFIHKDLKTFLKTQTKFYINQEILDVDSVITDAGSTNNSLIVIARVFKDISSNIIDKLSLLEELKKKVWEKKKFILQSNYVITLDKIEEYCGEEFLESILEEIVKNKEQLKEWKELFDIDVKSKKDLFASGAQQKLGGYKKEYLKLPVDTKHFSEEFKWELLSKIENIDEKLNGVLFHSENWQALNLLQEKYKEKIQCCYIDPPYNTGSDGFIYKDGFNHSSWMTMMNARLHSCKTLLKNNALIFVSIDEHENHSLKFLLNEAFINGFAADLIWNTQHSQQSGLFKPYHEYVLTYANVPSKEIPNFTGGEGQIDAGAIKKISKANPESEFEFPAGVRCEAMSGTEFKNNWGDVEKTYLKKGRFLVENGKTKYAMTLSAGWTQKEQMKEYFQGKEVYDTKDQKVVEFYFNSAGKLKCIKERTKITPSTILPSFGTVSKSTEDLKDMFGHTLFTQPKPVSMLSYLTNLPSQEHDIVIDFFAGSGTTGHAILVNNADEKNGKENTFILIEMGNHFYSVLNPRIKKVLYSFSWKDGKPQDMSGIGGFFKYHELEQYEDALENIQFKQVQLDIFEDNDQLLKYYLEDGIDKSKSKNFLGVDTEEEFLDLKIKTLNKDGTNSLSNVDLIETFNYLIGLETEKMEIQVHNKTKYYIITGKQNNNQTLIIWRDPSVDKEKDKETITKFLQKKSYTDVFVNSDCLIRNYKNIYDEMRKRLW